MVHPRALSDPVSPHVAHQVGDGHGSTPSFHSACAGALAAGEKWEGTDRPVPLGRSLGVVALPARMRCTQIAGMGKSASKALMHALHGARDGLPTSTRAHDARAASVHRNVRAEAATPAAMGPTNSGGPVAMCGQCRSCQSPLARVLVVPRAECVKPWSCLVTRRSACKLQGPAQGCSRPRRRCRAAPLCPSL
jgi:hypothetical protein